MSEFSEVRARIEAATSRQAIDHGSVPRLSAALLKILDLPVQGQGPFDRSSYDVGYNDALSDVRDAIYAAFGLDRSKEQHHE